VSDAQIRVLVAEDEEHLGAILEHFLAGRGYAVTMCRDGRTALTALQSGRYDVALLDIVMPELDGLEVLRQLQSESDPPEVITITGNGTIDTAITAIKLGAYDYIAKPYRMAEIDVMVRRAWEKRELARANQLLRARVSGCIPATMAAEGVRMRELVARAASVAPGSEPVIIQGEAGVGKTHLARYIHGHSHRPADVYVEIVGREEIADMRAYLFGDVRSDTSRQVGVLQRAERGTVVLDANVLTNDERAALADVLASRTFTPRGGDPVPLLARVIVCERIARAGMASLTDAMPGTRLSVPPLRERADDYGPLASQLLAYVDDGRTRTMTPDAIAVLTEYSWPANVRELRAVLVRAAILATSFQLTAADVRNALSAAGPTVASASTTAATTAVTTAATTDASAGLAVEAAMLADVTVPVTLADLERSHIGAMLVRHHWHQGRAAEALGISTKTLYRKMREYGFTRPRKRRLARSGTALATPVGAGSAPGAE
jgi:DNA-binding NtrC family response regulator